MRALALVLALSLTGCGTIRALAGPDPALVIVVPTIRQALANDSAAHPENKPRNDEAGKAIDGAVNPPTVTAPEAVMGIGAFFTSVPGLAAIGTLITAIGGVLYNRRQTQVVGAAVAQHAELIDSVTADSADDAKKV